jgi:hypothetical protein
VNFTRPVFSSMPFNIMKNNENLMVWVLHASGREASIKKAGPMTKFRITCPECGAVVITASPEAMLWELCPGCGRHVWDGYDALMADVFSSGDERSAGIHPDN